MVATQPRQWLRRLKPPWGDRPPLEERGRMTLFEQRALTLLCEHLAELRRRLIISVIAVFVGGVVVYIVYSHVLAFFLRPYCQILKDHHDHRACTLYVQNPVDQLTIRLKVSFFGGLGLALPVLLWQIWRFITPGLHPKE